MHTVTCSECPRPVYGAQRLTCSDRCRLRRSRRLRTEDAAHTRDVLAALVSAVESGDVFAASRARNDARGVLAANRRTR